MNFFNNVRYGLKSQVQTILNDTPAVVNELGMCLINEVSHIA